MKIMSNVSTFIWLERFDCGSVTRMDVALYTCAGHEDRRNVSIYVIDTSSPQQFLEKKCCFRGDRQRRFSLP